MTKSLETITFVIGAGASSEVDMPTGRHLRQLIADALSFHFNASSGDSTIRESISLLGQRRMWHSEGHDADYFKAARLIHGAMPAAPSIDNFIDSHKSEPIVAECAKLAIAQKILKAERASKLYVASNNSHNRLDLLRVENTWFTNFFELLNTHAELDDLKERLNRIKIITFNYDRTLEHFLHQIIQIYYSCNSEKAAEVLESLVILHPYGQVGALPWHPQQDVFKTYFGAELRGAELIEVAKSLRTFTEGINPDESRIDEIRSSVNDADKLVFLGFAYHELNLNILFDPPTTNQIRYEKQVYGTAKGISASNLNQIRKELAALGRYDREQIILRDDLSAGELFSEFSLSLKL